MYNEKKLQDLINMEILLKNFYKKNEYCDATNLEVKILTEYKLYIENYGKEDIGTDLPTTRGLDYSDDDEGIVLRYKTEYKGNLNNKFRGIYKNIVNYNDTLNTMYKRDLIRLGKNRNAINEVYSNQKNWLRDIKYQAKRNNYSFS